jgi:hypothetical protein
MSLNHVHDSSASYCNGSTLLFYNANTGEAASGVVNSTGFQTIKTFAPGAFAKGWTSVANADSLNLLMFYNSYTGAAAIGNSDRGNFTTTQTFNNSSKGWTNILYAGLTKGSTAEPLFYNSSSAPAGGFAPGSGAVAVTFGSLPSQQAGVRTTRPSRLAHSRKVGLMWRRPGPPSFSTTTLLDLPRSDIFSPSQWHQPPIL